MNGFYDNRLDGIITFIQFIISDVLIDRMFSGDGKDVLPEKYLKYYLCIPTFFLVILKGIFNCSVMDVVVWEYNNIGLYAFLLMFLAVGKVIGAFFDSMMMVASYDYYKNNHSKRLNLEEMYTLFKFGNVNCIEQGKGVYDWNFKNVIYEVVSQLLGSLCPLGMLLFLRILPGFDEFLKTTGWIDWFQILAPTMLIAPLSEFRGKQHMEHPVDISGGINLDNFLLNRTHILMSTLSLWFTDVSVLEFGTMYLVYGVANFKKFDLSFAFVVPIMLLIIFLVYLAISPVAIKYHAVSINGYVIGRWIVVAVVVFTLIVSRWTINSIITIISVVLILVIWDILIKKLKRKIRDVKTWEEMTAWIKFLPIIAFVVVIVSVGLQLEYG